MNRETTNRLRFVFEELLPPIVRDSRLFLWLMDRIWSGHMADLAEFRARAPYLTPEEYEQLYRDHPRVHDETDNSQGCIDAIVAACEGASSILDVGCGTGALLRAVADQWGDGPEYVGVDLVVDQVADHPLIDYKAALVEELPFDDDAFDTVVCTHTLEHILDLPKALAELRRVAKRQLLIVVPKEREYKYTFNPHFHFFAYDHTVLRAFYPLPDKHGIRTIGRDFFYWETF